MSRLPVVASLSLIVACNGTPAPQAPSGPQPGASVAVYQDGAIVEQRVWLDLEPGIQTVTLEGVAAQARPGSLWAAGVGDAGGVRVVAAALRGALEPDAITARHRGQVIRVVTGTETLEGTLVEIDAGSIAVRRDDRVELIPRDAVRAVHLPHRGGAGAAIELELEAARGGRQLVEVAYSTAGIGWSAHYEVDVRDAGAGATVRLRAAATVHNTTEVRFDQARLSLHAGKLADVTAPTVWRGTGPLPGGDQTVAFAAGNTEMPARFELVAGVSVEHDPGSGQAAGFGEPTYGNDTHSIPVIRRLSFRNRSGGALELPPGPVTVTLRSADRPPETVRVPLTDAVPPGEAVELSLGRADGIHVVRRQKAFMPRAGDRLERYELGVSNTRDQPVTVAIRERVPAVLGAVALERSRPHARLTGRTVAIDLTVEAHATALAIYEIVLTPRK
jgi:hypothetical protein